LQAAEPLRKKSQNNLAGVQLYSLPLPSYPVPAQSVRLDQAKLLTVNPEPFVAVEVLCAQN
jgi:hypothetical protein